jgi:hypothetical protein
MKKFLPAILVIGFIPLFLFAVSLLITYIDKNGPDVTDNNSYSTGPVITPESTDTVYPTDDTPLPQDEALIRNFFTLINEKHIPDAIKLMGTEILGTDPVQANGIIQEYGVVFNSWNQVTITSVKAVDKSSWPDTEHTYMVDVELKLQPSPPSQVWAEGTNTRFITVVNENGTWKIDSLDTGF